MVAGPSAVDAHRSLQQVVAPLGTGTQAVVPWQVEHALQVSHRAAHVALRLTVALEVGVVVGEVALGVVAVGEGERRVLVEIDMAVPVHVERHCAALAGLPLSACREALVVVLHVVGLDVDAGVLALGAVDALPVGRALGVELQLGAGVEGHAVVELVVGEAVDGLVP